MWYSRSKTKTWTKSLTGNAGRLTGHRQAINTVWERLSRPLPFSPMTQLISLLEPPPDLLAIQVTQQAVRSFFPLLQRGFSFGALVGCSIRELLCEQLRLDEAYVAQRVSTIFLDGKPVDDIDAAVVRDGSVLSLSAAMPGLVGAAMRKGGAYAYLRDAITARESGGCPSARPGLVRMKLFNMVMEELGPGFLRRGAIVRVAELTDFFGEQSPTFWETVVDTTLNGTPIAHDLLSNGKGLSGESIMLSVVQAEED